MPSRRPKFPLRVPTHGVLFDVGYGLLDEGPRLEAALRWLARYLTARGLRVSASRLRTLYRQACREPVQEIGGLLVQAALAAGASEELAQRQRREMPWDAAPMPALPGAVPAVRRLRDAGLRVGVLANQPASAIEDLERAGLLELLDDLWLSEVVGLMKPDPAIFRLALTRWGLRPGQVAYVGDRPDNDVAPARRLGLHAVRLLVGPHAHQPARTAMERADHEARTLRGAVDHLLTWGQGGLERPTCGRA